MILVNRGQEVYKQGLVLTSIKYTFRDSSNMKSSPKS